MKNNNNKIQQAKNKTKNKNKNKKKNKKNKKKQYHLLSGLL